MDEVHLRFLQYSGYFRVKLGICIRHSSTEFIYSDCNKKICFHAYTTTVQSLPSNNSALPFLSSLDRNHPTCQLAPKGISTTSF